MKDLKANLFLLSGESDIDLLSLYLELAKNKILNYTNRTVMLEQFEMKQLELACIMLQRRNMEGEDSHSEGGISSTFTEYEKILAPLSKYRLAKVGGVAHEKKQDETVSNISEK